MRSAYQYAAIAVLACAGFGHAGLGKTRAGAAKGIVEKAVTTGTVPSCANRVSGECGHAVKILFADGASKIFPRPAWAADVESPTIATDRRTVGWEVWENRYDPEKGGPETRDQPYLAEVIVFRTGLNLRTFDGCPCLGYHFDSGGKRIVLTYGDAHQEGWSERQLMDIETGRRIATIKADPDGNAPKGAPDWAKASDD